MKDACSGFILFVQGVRGGVGRLFVEILFGPGPGGYIFCQWASEPKKSTRKHTCKKQAHKTQCCLFVVSNLFDLFRCVFLVFFLISFVCLRLCICILLFVCTCRLFVFALLYLFVLIRIDECVVLVIILLYS